MAARRIDAVLLTNANDLLSGIVTDKALLEEWVSTRSFSDKYLIQSHEDPSISRQLATKKSNIDITSQLVDDTQHREPVYDTSPRALEKNLSSSSICSDLHMETTGTSSPPILVKRSPVLVKRSFWNEKLKGIPLMAEYRTIKRERKQLREY